MHTVAETRSFQRAAKDAGMTDEEVFALITHLAANPADGVEMAGTGGCRKLRWARRGSGKSGGYRTITFYSGTEMPVFLLTVFTKGEKANLSQAERNALGVLTKAIADAYRARVTKVEIE